MGGSRLRQICKPSDDYQWILFPSLPPCYSSTPRPSLNYTQLRDKPLRATATWEVPATQLKGYRPRSTTSARSQTLQNSLETSEPVHPWYPPTLSYLTVYVYHVRNHPRCDCRLKVYSPRVCPLAHHHWPITLLFAPRLRLTLPLDVPGSFSIIRW